MTRRTEYRTESGRLVATTTDNPGSAPTDVMTDVLRDYYADLTDEPIVVTTTGEPS